MENQFLAERLRRRVARDVVGGRAESAGHEDQVGAGERFLEGLGDGHAIRDGDLPLHPQPEVGEALRQVGEVGVVDVAEQKLRAGVDDLDAHEKGYPRCFPPSFSSAEPGDKSKQPLRDMPRRGW